MRSITRMAAVATLSLIALQGCRSTPDPDVEARQERVPVRRDAAKVEDYAERVVTAQTPAEEAQAIRDLRKWMAENSMTYTLRAAHLLDNTPVDDPSAVNEAVRVEITVFRGREPVRNFVFQPKDNRNLAILGE